MSIHRAIQMSGMSHVIRVQAHPSYTPKQQASAEKGL